MRYLKPKIVAGCVAVAALTSGCDEAGPSGNDGQSGTNGADGEEGASGTPGANGEDGSPGAPGSSCTISELESGDKLLQCADGTSVTIPKPHVDREPAVAGGRLFFGDAESDAVRALDLTTGLIVGTVSGVAPGASLYTTESGRVVAAVQGAAHRVDFIDSGLRVEQQGQTQVETEGQVQKLTYAMVGDVLDARTPIHFVSHHGYVSVFFDGFFDTSVAENHVPATSVVVAETELLGEDPTVLQVSTEPQHGVSFVTGEGKLLSSAPSSDRAVSTAPNGFFVYNLEGTLEQTIQNGDDFDASCWGLHGEAAVGNNYLFGCHESLDGGISVLAWSEENGRYESRKIKYPGYPAATKRTSVLKGHPKSQYAVGQWGRYGAGGSEYTGLVRIDPSASEITATDTIELGSVYCDYGFELSEGKTVVALARDGRVHSIDVPSWSGHKTAQLLPASETTCAGRLVVGEGAAYITRAEKGEILELDIATLEVTRTFNVGGKPGNATLAGFWAPIEAPQAH
jgi:hypothetical protein